jgi:hypothetical protein
MASVENSHQSPPPMPTRQVLGAALGAGAVGLVVGLIALSLNLAGVIDVTLAYGFLVAAWGLGTVAFVASEFVWVRPPRHRLILAISASIALAVALGGIGYYEHEHNATLPVPLDNTVGFECDSSYLPPRRRPDQRILMIQISVAPPPNAPEIAQGFGWLPERLSRNLFGGLEIGQLHGI